MTTPKAHTGIIYAAGINSRLVSQINHPFKGMCTTPSGDSLIALQAKHLIALHISRLVLVVGTEHETLISHLRDALSGLEFSVAFNLDYSTKGNMLSMWAAKEWCGGKITFTTSDLYFSGNLPVDFAKGNDSQILTDTTRVDQFNDPDPVKVSIQGELITRVNKSLPVDQVGGIAPGFYHFNASGAQNLFDDIHKEISAGRDDQSLYWSIDRITSNHKIRPIYFNSNKWIDVDTPSDLFKLSNI